MSEASRPSEIEAGLAPADAARVYGRMGRSLALGRPFEGRARALAQSWLEPPPGSAVLEVGVGLGETLAFACASPAGRVVGVDVTPEMLRFAQKAAPAARLVRGSVTALPLRDASFERAFVGYTLDLLPSESIPLALSELRRVLRPEGRLVLCSLGEGKTGLETLLMGAWKRLHRLFGPAAVGGCRPLTLGPLLPPAGFETLRSEHVGQLGTPSEVILARAV